MTYIITTLILIATGLRFTSMRTTVQTACAFTALGTLVGVLIAGLVQIFVWVFGIDMNLIWGWTPVIMVLAPVALALDWGPLDKPSKQQ